MIGWMIHRIYQFLTEGSTLSIYDNGTFDSRGVSRLINTEWSEAVRRGVNIHDRGPPQGNHPSIRLLLSRAFYRFNARNKRSRFDEPFDRFLLQ